MKPAMDTINELLKHPPLCGVCGVPVERITFRIDEMKLRAVFTVFCHGDTEEAALDQETFHEIPDGIRSAVAFTSKALPPVSESARQGRIDAGEVG